jgi:DNA-binding transcriptional regulator LsrR (DeoR family)
MKQIGDELGVPRGSIGRLLTEARRAGMFVVSIDSAMGQKRSLAALFNKLGPDEYRRYMSVHTTIMRQAAGCRVFPPLSDTTRQAIIERWQAGARRKFIAKTLGCDPIQVNNVLNAARAKGLVKPRWTCARRSTGAPHE